MQSAKVFKQAVRLHIILLKHLLRRAVGETIHGPAQSVA